MTALAMALLAASKRPTMAWWEWIVCALMWCVGLALYSIAKGRRW